jgi:uncharacterized protein YceH (UPF0502 family)
MQFNIYVMQKCAREPVLRITLAEYGSLDNLRTKKVARHRHQRKVIKPPIVPT